MTEVGVYEARNNLSGLIKRVKAGEEITITSHGQPQARLVMVEPVPELGSALAVLTSLQDVEPSGRSLEEVDRSIGAQRDSWE